MAAKTTSQSEEVARPYGPLDARESKWLHAHMTAPRAILSPYSHTVTHMDSSPTDPLHGNRLLEQSVILDIGCGTRKAEPGALGIDRSPGSATDIVWDLDQYPWPLAANRFERIHLSHIIEHVHDVIATMAEVHRIAQPGASVFITTPHFSSHNSYTDPTHVRHLAAASFQHLTGKNFESFNGAPFRFDIQTLELTFGGNFLLDNLGRALARGNLKWYERHAAWVFPALDIRCHLRAVK